MRIRLSIPVLTLVVIFSLTAVVQAELSDQYSEWAEGPERFLLTKDEVKVWKTIDSDAEAKRFIDLFWARRDPNLDNPFNEFKAEFEGRVRYADENFTYAKKRGALTDRAKVLILLGIPHQAERRGPTETVQSVGATTGATGMGTDQVRSNVEMWNYDPAKLPEGFTIKGTQILFIFYEEKMASNNFVLDRSHQDAIKGMRTLSKAPPVFFIHPDLMEVPKPVSIPGASAATSAQLAWLDAGTAPLNDRAIVLLDAGVADDIHRPLWLHVELPVDAPKLETIAGRVLDPKGEVLSNFQTETTPIAAGAGSTYHVTFPVADGSYKIEVVGVAGGVPQVIVAVEHEIDPIPLEGTWMSPLWVGIDAERDDEAARGSAFTFGGWHLAPLTAESISKNNQLSYFGYVVRPGLDAQGTTKIKVKIVLKKDGQRMGKALRLDLPTAKVAGDLYLYANALNLAGFPAPGEFALEFTIEDFVSKVKIERDIAVSLTE